MPRDVDTETLLLSNIRDAAERVCDARMPATWAGSQLVSLIRF
jgi:hypothetical protein